MNMLFDFLPIVAFFIAYKLYDIYVATMVAMVAAIVHILYQRVRYQQWQKMGLVTLAFIMVLGGATLLFQNELFIKWKPSVVNWAFALALITARLYYKQPMLQKLLGNQQQTLNLPTAAWHTLDKLWMGFFVFSGAANLYVAYTFATDVWVNFRLFGMLAITLVFVLAQAVYIAIKHKAHRS